MTVWNDASYTGHLAHANWMAHTSVLMYLNERATGDPARDWLSSWAHRYFVGDGLRVLVLGCGDGWLERALAEWPFVASILAVDVAEDAVQRAREAARGQQKIEYGVVDLNRDDLPFHEFDVVVAHSVLHHVENLEHAFEQVHGTMKDGATFIVNEYVGPNRFQFSDDVLHIMNGLLQAVRPGERRSRPTVEEMVANDPTEAVRAAELPALLRRSFDVLEEKPLGGTILQHLLYGVVGDYRFEVPRERGIIETLCAIEAMLLDVGRVRSDFALFAARKRKSNVVAEARPLPPRPPAALDVEPDPLQRMPPMRRPAGDLRVRGDKTVHWNAAMRVLRVALASQQAQRANLFQERRAYEWRERLRARGRDPWQWALALLPDDPPFLRLVETAATLAAE